MIYFYYIFIIFLFLIKLKYCIIVSSTIVLSKLYYNTGVIIKCNGESEFGMYYKAAKDKNKLLNRFMSLLQELF